MGNLHAINVCLAGSQFQRKQFNNASHLVLPVVMLTVGVHNGSNGPLYYPAEELRNSSHLWNGKPVLVNHPMDGGVPASANTPRVWEGQVLGQIWNAVFDGLRLKAEIWLNEERTKNISPGLIRLLTQGNNIEVSTGLFSTDEQSSGEWNGEQYTAIARKHVPDHLAILPDQRGACSWADGCGIRNDADHKGFIAAATFSANLFTNRREIVMTAETPLTLPTLNESKKDNETPQHNTAHADEYDMDIERLWEKAWGAK